MSMQLTSEQLTEIVQTICTQDSSIRTSERRRQVRIGLRYKISIRKLLDASGVSTRKTVFLRDVSVGGVGLCASFRLNEGEGMVIELPRKDGSCHELICMVTHVKSMPGGVFHIGGRFMAPFEHAPHRKRQPAAKD